MGKTYTRPVMYCETFTTQAVCANCTANMDVTFDCMAGGQRDTANVLTNGCTNVAGKLGGTEEDIGTYTAVNNSNYSSGHSTYNSNLDWNNSTKSASASNAWGLLYICYVSDQGGFTTSHWQTSGNTATHSSSVSMEHVQIAPVFGDAESIATSC